MTEQLKTCRACGYTRRSDDLAPDYECPKCERVYAKSDAGEAGARESTTAFHEIEEFVKDNEPAAGRGRKVMIAVALLGAVVAGGYWVYAEHEAKLAEREANMAALDRVKRVAEQWDDTMRVLEVTPRLAASGPVGDLQALHRDLRNMDVPACVNPARDALVRATGLHLDAVMAVLRNDDPRAQQIMVRYKEEMDGFSDISLDCQ